MRGEMRIQTLISISCISGSTSFALHSPQNQSMEDR